MKVQPNSRELLPVLAAIAGGLLFWTQIGYLWPLASTELLPDPDYLAAQASSFVAGRGVDLHGYSSASLMFADEEALEYLEKEAGIELIQSLIRSAHPLIRHNVVFKKREDPTIYRVRLLGSGKVVGWSHSFEDDKPGDHLPPLQAKALVEETIRDFLDQDPEVWELKTSSLVKRLERTDHYFVYEREIESYSGIREELKVLLTGSVVSGFLTDLVVPPHAERTRRSDTAASALAMVGFGFAVVGILVAFVVFLRAVRDSSAPYGLAASWSIISLVCMLGAVLLQRGYLFARWDPLQPLWYASLSRVGGYVTDYSFVALVFLIVIGAGDAVDRKMSGGRGSTLRAISRGHLLQESVVLALARGVMVGLIVAGVLSLAVLVIREILGGQVVLQPRGMSVYILNSECLTLSIPLFFIAVAAAEELSYRFFLCSWLLVHTGSRIIAVVIPAFVYGLTHADLDFLPPAEPFWGRFVVLALVGVVWGWAFFRYDALTVVASHFAADLFIFNFPRLASGDTETQLWGFVTLGLPLLPVLMWVVWRSARAVNRRL